MTGPTDTPAFLLVQGADPVWVGHVMGWWRRPAHVVFANLAVDGTPTTAVRQIRDSRDDPCPINPWTVDALAACVVNWEPLWIPQSNLVRQQQILAIAQDRRDRAERAAKAAALREQRALEGPKRKRRRAAEPEPTSGEQT